MIAVCVGGGKRSLATSGARSSSIRSDQYFAVQFLFYEIGQLFSIPLKSLRVVVPIEIQFKRRNKMRSEHFGKWTQGFRCLADTMQKYYARSAVLSLMRSNP